MISITTFEQSLVPQAKKLAHQWGLPFSDLPQDEFFLQLTTQSLQLTQNNTVHTQNSFKPIIIDFSCGKIAHRRHFGGGKGQTIAKAVALNKSPLPIILDATAGMGKDAFVFASLGASVILMERSPIVAALLSDALQRGNSDPEISSIIQRMSLFYGDARLLTKDILIKSDKSIPDVIYLDPMFPHRKKSALVKKEMLIFQSIIGHDVDSNELLNACCQIAKKRVVVKRPIKAPFLDNTKPSLSMTMKKHRFDIYFCSNK